MVVDDDDDSDEAKSKAVSLKQTKSKSSNRNNPKSKMKNFLISAINIFNIWPHKHDNFRFYYKNKHR